PPCSRRSWLRRLSCTALAPKPRFRASERGRGRRDSGLGSEMRALVIFLICLSLCGAARADEPAKGWLGATGKDPAVEDPAKLGMEGPHGVTVTSRAAGAPAEKAGLEAGDVIVNLDRMLVEDKAGFEADLSAKVPGTEIKLIVRRGASEKRLTVVLAAEP